MMKKFKFLSVFVIAALIFSGCAEEVPNGKRVVDLYFVNSARDTLVKETGYIDEKDFDDVEELVEAVMERLLDGPSKPEHYAVIPEDITLKGVSESEVTDGVINIDLGGDYYPDGDESYTVSDELLARYSIVCTLCQFDGIEKVKFFINGEHMRGSCGKGEILQPLGSEMVMMNSPSSVDTQTEKFVTLYFTDADGKKLYPETRKATMTDNSTEKTVVSELIRGPVSADYVQTVPAAASIISVETTEEVCFVNLTSDFTSKLKRGSGEEKLAVYSIVNSLTCIPGIEKVQILIDGKKPEEDIAQLFSSPLEKNEKLIQDTGK